MSLFFHRTRPPVIRGEFATTEKMELAIPAGKFYDTINIDNLPLDTAQSKRHEAVIYGSSLLFFSRQDCVD